VVKPGREAVDIGARARATGGDDEERGRAKRGGIPGKAERAAPAPVKKAGDDRTGRQRLTLANALDDQQRERSLASLKRQRERQKLQALGTQQERVKIARQVQLPEAITIQELANRMAERAVDIIKFLMKQGQMLKMNDVIDADTAELVAAEFGHTVKRVSEEDVEEGFIGEVDAPEMLKPRAPVVTIMGHVDHGKTSLLDALRQTNVVAGEAGGITQHIGAYQVVTNDGNPVTFIDTPGHAAFTAMRARGAKVTDIVVLVVAADDGVMPQTVEAINHAKAAGVPIIVAINKIDKPAADPLRVRTDLLSHDVVVESMGGDTLEVEVSAKEKLNLDKLLEAIHLQSEVLELAANPDRAAEGIVIEAKLERGRGPVGTVLVQRGTLRVGQIIVAGRAWGRVRALIDDKGQNVVEAGPSVPVEVLGFDSAPEAGDQLAVVDTESRARELTEYRVRKLRDVRAVGARSSLEQQMSQAAKGGKKEFLLIIKGDVQGSVEAIIAALEKLGNEEVGARIIHSAVGGIASSDVALAEASGAVIIAFNVRADAQAKQQAERDGIEIRYYNIIYDLVDDVKKAMSGLLPPVTREEFLGNAEILEVFNISKVGKVAGCRVTEGKVERGASVRLIRDNVVIHQGKLSTLKRFKDEVREVVAGQECGMAFENYQDLKQGDVIECFRTEIVVRSL
jgi:translation initiation factor IF-2